MHNYEFKMILIYLRSILDGDRPLHLFYLCLKQAILGQLSSNWLILSNRRFEQLVSGTYMLKAREHREDILNTEDPFKDICCI